MKYRTLINTQCLENYGAHDENGKFVDGNGYWKFKGGEQYIVSSKEYRTANAVAFLSAMLQKDNNSLYSKELIVSWEEIEEDWKPNPEEEWCVPVELDIEEYFEEQKKAEDDKSEPVLLRVTKPLRCPTDLFEEVNNQ